MRTALDALRAAHEEALAEIVSLRARLAVATTDNHAAQEVIARLQAQLDCVGGNGSGTGSNGATGSSSSGSSCGGSGSSSSGSGTNDSSSSEIRPAANLNATPESVRKKFAEVRARGVVKTGGAAGVGASLGELNSPEGESGHSHPSWARGRLKAVDHTHLNGFKELL